MAIYNGTHHVVRFESGEIWDFYAEQNKGISYRRLNHRGVWEQPITLVTNTQEDFSIKIDNMDHLHLICYSRTGELFYYFNNGLKWTKQVLSKYEPIRYTIRYPMIIPINNKIHILFAIGATFSTGYWTLYHYYWDEHIWHSKEITRLTAGYRLSPFYADMSDKYIHLVYRGLATHQYQIFYCRYHLEHAIWSSPENVTQGAADCNMPSLLIKDDLLHLTWVTLSKTDLIVKYKYKPIRSLGKVEWSQPVQLNREGSNASFPRLIWAEGKLWCLWYQADNLFGASSSKGENWSEPSSLPEFERTNFHNIHYSTNQSREKEIFQLQWILGNLDKTFSLPIVGPLMELPEYSPAPPATLWEDNKNIEVTNGKESVNETIKESLMEASKESAKDPIESDSQNIREKAPRRNASAGAHSLESILFTEFDRQEEFHYSVITKLEEQAKLDESILKELSQALMFAKQNYETLQALKNEVELIKQDVRQLKKRGWFNRMFHNES